MNLQPLFSIQLVTKIGNINNIMRTDALVLFIIIILVTNFGNPREDSTLYPSISVLQNSDPRFSLSTL